MKLYGFAFELLSFSADTDGEFYIDIGSWRTVDHRGSLFLVLKMEHWEFDFLSLKTLYRIYLNWREQ